MGQQGIFQITKNEMLKWNNCHNLMKTHRWDAGNRNRSTSFFHRWIYGKLVNDKCKTWTFDKSVNNICHAIGIYRSTLCKFFYIYVKYRTTHICTKRYDTWDGYNILYQIILMLSLRTQVSKIQQDQ